jgi:hypothetical protein
LLENNSVLLWVEARQKLDPLRKGRYEINKAKVTNAVTKESGKGKHQDVHTNMLKPCFSIFTGDEYAATQVDKNSVV